MTFSESGRPDAPKRGKAEQEPRRAPAPEDDNSEKSLRKALMEANSQREALQAQLMRSEAARAAEREGFEAQKKELLEAVAEAQAQTEDATAFVAKEQQRLGQRITLATDARDQAAMRADAAERTSADSRLKASQTAQKARLALEHASMLEREAFRERARADAAEARIGAITVQLTTTQGTVERQVSDIASMRQELAVAKRPSADMVAELERLQTDNRRLLTLLEASGGAAAVAGPKGAAALGTCTYVSLGAELEATAVTSRRYAPLLDRQALLHAEEMACWVPRDAVEAAQEFLHAAGTPPPSAEYMGLILKLNRIWRVHEERRVEAERGAAREREAALARKLKQLQPAEQVVQEHTIAALQSQLAAVRAAARWSGGQENKMLDWGLGAIEKVAAQGTDAAAQNADLRRRLAEMQEAISGGGGGGPGGSRTAVRAEAKAERPSSAAGPGGRGGGGVTHRWAPRSVV